MIAGVVLAAGTSSRLGRPKQLLDLHGVPILQHVVDAAAASRLDDVIVVLGHEAADIGAALSLPDRARIVVNPNYSEGQSSSLGAGVAAAPDDCEAVVVVLGDQPEMTAALIDRVITEWRAGESPVVRATFGGVPGHPVLIERSEFALVEEARGDEGLRSVLGVAGARVRELPLGDTPLADVDTQEHYESLKDG
ncbi:MAG: nucleotidyltransferase family protein [Actinomycetota bacterium]